MTKEISVNSDIIIPSQMVIQTLNNFRYAINTLPDDMTLKDKAKEAFIVHIDKETIIRMQNKSRGEFDNQRDEIIKQARIEDNPLKGVDLVLVRILYSILHENIKNELETMSAEELQKLSKLEHIRWPVTIRARKLLQKIGTYDPNKHSAIRIFAEIKKMSDLYGVLIFESGDYDIYPLITQGRLDPKSEIITYSSEYLERLAIEIAIRSIKKDRNNNPKINKATGKLERKAAYSYAISNEIYSEQNKHAIELTIEIVQIIEKTNEEKGGVPHIRIQRLIDRCKTLRYDMKNKSRATFAQTLRRAFARAEILLVTRTDITKRYKNLKIPDMSNIGLKALKENILLEFPNDGKNKM